MTLHTYIRHITLILGIISVNSIACAASFNVQVTNEAEHPIADVVVYAEPVSGYLPVKSLHVTEIEQKGRAFSPLVTVIQTNTAISFPNNDTVRHHVYSFSPTKVFELKLYSGILGTPISFEKAGTVIVGCNIHDKMVAYIHVVNTPYFGKTDASGKVKLDNLLPGKYQLKAWHFNLPVGSTIPEQSIEISGNENPASFRLLLKNDTFIP